MNQDMFADIKVGDTVYSVNGVALKVMYTYDCYFRTEGGALWKKADGKAEDSYYDNRVFWQPVNIIPPPKPKRLVKKTGYAHKFQIFETQSHKSDPENWRHVTYEVEE